MLQSPSGKERTVGGKARKGGPVESRMDGDQLQQQEHLQPHHVLCSRGIRDQQGCCDQEVGGGAGHDGMGCSWLMD